MSIVNYRVEVDMSKAPNAARMQAAADEEIGAGLTEMGLVVERFVKEETPLGATKLLRGSIFSEPRGNPIREMLISSPQLYAPFVERGRAPGKMPPVAPIELWVRRKLGEGDPKKALSIAFAIAKSIAKKGTRALRDPSVGHMFEKGLRRALPAIERIAQKIGAQIVIRWDSK